MSATSTLLWWRAAADPLLCIVGNCPISAKWPDVDSAHTPIMRNQVWVGFVGAENAAWLATEGRTAMLASEYRPRDLGDGRIAFSARALGAQRELGEEEDGYL